MALGTVTVSDFDGASASDKLIVVKLSIPGDSSYPTGGSAAFSTTLNNALAAAGYPGSYEIVSVEPNGLNGGYEVIYDSVNNKLLTVVKSSGVETADTTNLSGTTFLLRVVLR